MKNKKPYQPDDKNSVELDEPAAGFTANTDSRFHIYPSVNEMKEDE